MLTATQFWTPERREEMRKWNAIRTSWRPAKLCRFKDGDNSGGTPIEKGPHKGFRFHERWPDGLRVMETCRSSAAKAQHLVSHGGWFTDSFQDGCIYACAVQVRIPRRLAKFENVQEGEYGVWEKSMTRVRWMEATAHTEWDQILISRRSSDLHDTLKECIRSADRVAEMAAEEAREDDMRDQADQQINQAEQDIAEADEVIEMCEKELVDMESCNHLIARGVLVERIQQEQATIRKLRDKIALLEREPWQAVA